MAVIADLAVKVGADIGDFLSGMGRVNSGIGALGGMAETAGKTIAAGFAVAGAGLLAAGAAGVKMAGDLEQSVANISTIKPEIDTSSMFASLNEMSTRIPQTGAELGKAAYDIFSSMDVSQAQALKLTEQFAKGAVGAGTDTQTFAAAAMGAMNAYKMSIDDADHVSDVFFNTVNKGVVTGAELAAGMGPLLASAKAMGVDFETAMAMAAGATKEGGNASQNLNNMTNLFNKLPTKDAAKGFRELGITVADSAGNLRSPIDILGDLKTKMAGMTEEAQALVLQKIFPDAQARQGAQVIMSQLDMVKESLATNRNSVGMTEDAYKKMSATFNSQSKLLGNTVNAILTTVGAELLPSITPVISAIAQGLPGAFATARAAIQPWVQVITDSFKTIQQVFAGTWVSAEGIHPVTRFIGEMAERIKEAIPTVLAFKDAFGKMLSGDIGGGFAQIGTIIAPAIKKLQDTFSDLGPTGERVGRAFDAIRNALAPTAGYLTTGNNAANTAKTVWEGFANVVNTTSGGIETGIGAIKRTLDGFSETAANLGSLKSVTDSLKSLADSAKRFGDTADSIGKAFGALTAGVDGLKGKDLASMLGTGLAVWVDVSFVKPLQAATIALEAFSKLLGTIQRGGAPEAPKVTPISGSKEALDTAALTTAAMQRQADIAGSVLAPALDFASQRTIAFGQSGALIGPVLDTAAAAQADLAAASTDTAAAVAEAGTATAEAATGTAEAIKTSAVDAEAAKSGIMTILDGMKSEIAAKVGEMASAGGAKFDDLWSAGLAAATGMSQDVTAQATAMSENVVAAVEGMVSSGGAAAQGLSTAISGAVSAAVAVAQGAAGEFQAAGVAMGQGLVTGIQSQTGAVTAAAAALASAAAGAARAALQVSSPSKVMGDIGKEGGAGLAEGFDESTPGSVEAVTRHVRAVKDAATKELDDMVRAVRDQLSEMNRAWDDAFRKAKDFAGGMLTGEKAASDALFENEQQALAIQKRINELKLAGAGTTKLSQDGKKQIAVNQALDDELKLQEQKLATLRLEADQIRINERLENDRSRRELKAMVDFSEEMSAADRAAAIQEQLDVMGSLAPSIDAATEQLALLERKGPDAFEAIANSATEATKQIAGTGKALADMTSGKSGGSAGDFGAIGPPIYPYIYPGGNQGEPFGGAGLGDFESLPSASPFGLGDTGAIDTATVEADTAELHVSGDVKVTSSMQSVQIILNLPGGAQIVAAVLAEPPELAKLADGISQYNQMTGARGG